MFDINELTLEQIKEIAKFNLIPEKETNHKDTLNKQLGEFVIIRTYSAGVWFGKLSEKSGNEVILTEARRMYQWWAKKSISLSGVAKYGIKNEESKICPALDNVWLEAIEILSLTKTAIESIKGAKDVEAK